MTEINRGSKSSEVKSNSTNNSTVIFDNRKFNTLMKKLTEDGKHSIGQILNHISKGKPLPNVMMDIISESGADIDFILKGYDIVKAKKANNVNDPSMTKERQYLLSILKKHHNEISGEDGREKYANLVASYNEFLRRYKISPIKFDDGSIDYEESMKKAKVEENRELKHEEEKQQLKQIREKEIHRLKNTLLKADFERLDMAIAKGLERYDRLTNKIIPSFIVNELGAESKFELPEAIKYFSDKYFPAYDEMHKEGIHPAMQGRIITNHPISGYNKNGKIILDLGFLKGEIEVINIVRNLLAKRVDIMDIYANKSALYAFQEQAQKFIDIYYEVLKTYEVRTYNKEGHGKWLPFDMNDPDLFRKSETKNKITTVSVMTSDDLEYKLNERKKFIAREDENKSEEKKRKLYTYGGFSGYLNTLMDDYFGKYKKDFSDFDAKKESITSRAFLDRCGFSNIQTTQDKLRPTYINYRTVKKEKKTLM